jgi:hypothetical protein
MSKGAEAPVLPGGVVVPVTYDVILHLLREARTITLSQNRHHHALSGTTTLPQAPSRYLISDRSHSTYTHIHTNTNTHTYAHAHKKIR